MKDHIINYETFIKISNAISHSKEPEEVALMTVEEIKKALDIKGCALFLLDHKTQELEVAASYGLSEEYLNKGPVSVLHSIAESLKDGPVAIFDVADDPRLQYPEEAKKEGIASILSVPIHLHGKLLGALRVYSAEPWEFSLSDVNFVNGLAQIAGMAVDMAKYTKGLMKNIEVLKSLKDAQQSRENKKSSYTDSPKSYSPEEYYKQPY